VRAVGRQHAMIAPLYGWGSSMSTAQRVSRRLHRLAVFLAVIAALIGGRYVHAEATDPRLVFVTEYLRELSAQEDIRDNGFKEINQAPTPEEQMTSCIHSSTAFQLELNTDIGMLQGMHFAAPFDQLVPSIVGLYKRKIDLHQRLIDICTAMIGEEKPGVDYDKMVADMPKIRALLESMDQTLLVASGMAWAILIDQKPDSKNHLSHLIITRAERSELLRDLDAGFGQKLDDKNATYLVSSDALLKGLLTKNYKCADEPWQ
jgi:hypothetical protein